MSNAEGIDVSHHQPWIDWDAVRAAGKTFAFTRIANGITKDVTFSANWAGIQRVGLIRGCYQYYRFNQPIRDQVKLLTDTLGAYTVGDIPPVLDIEDPEITDYPRAVDGIRQWVELVRDAFKVQPLIYTNYAWGTRLNLPTFDCPLWVANYTTAAKPTLPPAWKDWKFWQFTASGAVAGRGPLDFNHYNGTLEELKAWLTPPPPRQPVPAPPSFWLEFPDGTMFDVPGESVVIKIHRTLPPRG